MHSPGARHEPLSGRPESRLRGGVDWHVRLTSLSLQGFKSFGNRTVIAFAPGITAIIGPNGSGKSNLIDALKWTTGGGRAREFRASDKTDLIFHGAAGKRGVSLAEVEVELGGDGRSLKVYRSLERDGTTRLRLNGRNTRFLDLEEALSGSGLGRAGVALIGQGEVSQVLMADPGKLLEYVAEVAGVGRMSARREQTQARLETARGHLDRLQDVVVELEERCGQLGDEAADAQHHAALSAESLQLRVTVARRRVEGLEAETVALHQRRSELDDAIRDGRGRLERLRSELETVKRERDERETAYRRAMAEAELKRGDLRVASERTQAARDRRDAAVQALEATRQEAERLDAAEPPSPPEDEPGRLTERETALQATLDGADRQLAEIRNLVVEARARHDALRTAHAEAERRAAAFETRRTELERQANELEARRRALDASAGDSLEELASREAAARERVESATAELERARATLSDVHERHARVEAERLALHRAADRQRAAFEARRGYAQGPRNALTSGIDGVIGSVGDLLRVPERYRPAIAAALGRRAEYVVVDRAETGRRVLAWVRERGGFVTVLPLDLLTGGNRRPPAALLEEPGVVGAAVDVVEIDARYRTVADQLLGGTALVESMEDATRLARGSGPRARMVALNGDILEASGAMSGGRRGGQASVLGAAAELEEAEAAAAEATTEAEAARVLLERQRTVLRGLQEQLPELTAALEAARSLAAAARERASRHQGLLDDLEQRSVLLARARAELGEPASPLDADELRSAEGAMTLATERLEAVRSRGEADRAALAEVRQHRLVLEERWRSYRAARERFDEQRARAATLRTSVGRQEQTLETLQEALTNAERSRAEAEAAMPTGLEEVGAALDAVRQRGNALEAEQTAETERQAARGQDLEACNVQLARREAALELAAEELAELPEGAEALDLSERMARTRFREVGEALEALGPVNHRAARDLEEATERKEGLEVEMVQAALAVTDLEGTLQRIDRETTARLQTALTRLRSSFQGHVKQLFGEEGRGDIDVDHEDGRPVGVRIRLQPPGKQTQSLHLLSVGERTMGALAFLFALMADQDTGSGLPIAVLDEVDAPLDEANIRRYCAFLERLAKAGTQFVLITHQKATFEVADVLWGVTTEGGVSRVFSIRRDEAAPVG